MCKGFQQASGQALLQPLTLPCALQLFKLLVGRHQQAVHTLDVVPALPPLDDYRPVDYGRWIPRNQTVVVQVPAPLFFPSHRAASLLLTVCCRFVRAGTEHRCDTGVGLYCCYLIVYIFEHCSPHPTSACQGVMLPLCTAENAGASRSVSLCSPPQDLQSLLTAGPLPPQDRPMASSVDAYNWVRCGPQLLINLRSRCIILTAALLVWRSSSCGCVTAMCCGLDG
jgi:hypothetical protein